ncbi:MalY/PatB family protein [Bacteroides hominis]|uniref:MalY/PatB family protein n=1 Tax=Bacteroides TaxID=816 RepID=UPI001D0E6386|nr:MULTISPECIES: MalY/PatB family protein [Bacteroides]MCC2233322.1 pyridoxal phosphate-dependent aminotransferase [Bacteroides hominis (ex Afrizal et al. 2022)]MCY6325279.1 pyridoxal phosphate-dependent aminotransferase [Bacteroides fragilis]MCZ2661467.1 pyridoxal phosphate-dependent aminotransferase [Bacteroides fragilis]MDV6134424.1 MalY/PatB family protein [Bacteroides hominis (ex Liu et al. 2022)]MDV6150827.1 MalY/PatB family protein [Bacteroides hominis (ex Liu et al. 2022)]
MKYDFDEIISRRNSNSYKWDAVMEEGVLPMWVADMDFRTAPAVVEVLRKRMDHGIFGYTKVPPVYYDAIINWFTRRHGWQIDRDWIIYTSGVVPALSAIIKALTVPGDRVLVQTPVYNCFFSSIRNNGCEIVANPLVYTNGTYRIDFDDLARKATDPKVRLLLLCNPHNPVGRVWTRAELMCIGEICLRNDVLVVADEIHCELVYSGHTYIPFASISDDFRNRSVTCTSPSKAFNLAGLQIANIFAADESVRVKIDKAINLNEVCDVNPFGVEALVAAYNDGEEWLEELKCYLSDNYLYMRTFFNKYLPQFPVVKLEGTYLVWVDCSVLNRSSKEIAEILLKAEKLWINEGSMYGEAGEGFIRINIACPRQILIDGLNRLKRGLKEISLCYCRDRQILLHDTIE